MKDSVKGILEKVKQRQIQEGKRGYSEEKLPKPVRDISKKMDGKPSILNNKNLIF